MKAWRCILSRGDAAEPETQAAYDGYGRTSQITAAGQPTQTFAYASTGEQIALTQAVGAVTAYGYDVMGQAVAVTSALGNVTVYEYDLRGNKTYEGGATYPVRYAYDAFGRNVGYSVDNERKQSIVYDPATGRIAESDGFRWDYLAGSNFKSQLTYPNDVVVTWSYEPHRDLLTAVTNATYSTYVYTNDLLGRRTSKNDEQSGIWSVVYNAENRPVRWTQGDTVITMAFDRLGRRVEMRTVKDGEETLQRFVYDNYLCVQQLRGTENTFFQSYVWDSTEPIATKRVSCLYCCRYMEMREWRMETQWNVPSL